ncbi:hypothetical protein [Virgibacillus salidurans]|nr:hypothetical protein [Virgibacillus sp. NKC19-16]
MMHELIGPCQTCGKNVYCEDGFFAGVHEDGQLLCEDCVPQNEN